MADIVFSADDRKLLADLALRLTGSLPDTPTRLESCFTNISRRMHKLSVTTLLSYLQVVDGDPRELAELLSAVTIHHTTWFRELPHFERIKQWAGAAAQRGPVTFEVLSAGCSTGEEVYSLALVLESIRAASPNFDYRVEGWDVDPVSIRNAKACIYPIGVRSAIPDAYSRFLLIGHGKSAGYFTLDKAIRDRCRFRQKSLVEHEAQVERKFHAIFCRNVLIYFTPAQVNDIIRYLMRFLLEDGTLSLGHSESIEAKDFALRNLGNACYQFPKAKSAAVAVESPLRNLRPPDLILVGASTGGTEALVRFLRLMPRDCPPILVVQHIAHAFAQSFAERLASAAGLLLGNPMPGSELRTGHLYMALGDYHLGLRQRGSLEIIDINTGPPQHSVRPAVDYLFLSASKLKTGKHIFAFVLTGMGKDGAKGLLQLKGIGATTFTQDEKSSVVFGMPAEAVALGASTFSGTPEELRAALLEALAKRSRTQNAS